MKTPLIIDNGTDTMRSGYAGEDVPRSVFPTVYGTLRYPFLASESDHDFREYYVGDEAMALRGILRVHYPIENGVISDWEGMERIWGHIFHTVLEINPIEHPILLAEPPLTSLSHREKMAEILFETFNVPAFTTFSTASLSLRAFGQKTGVVVEMGSGGVYIVPIYDDQVIHDAINRMDFGGRTITDHLRRLVRQRGHTFHGSFERLMCRDIKETLCYIVLDPECELRRLEQPDHPERYVNYTLPDGEILPIGPERFLAPEAFFQPAMIGEGISLPEAIYQTIQKCDAAIQKDLFQSILLTGGSSLFPGLIARLLKELTTMLPEGYKVGVFALPWRQFDAWIGGSIFALRNIFPKLWIWKQDYQKHGTLVTQGGLCSKFFVRSTSQSTPPHSLYFRNDSLCPLCGTSGAVLGQQINSDASTVFCPTCENIIQ